MLWYLTPRLRADVASSYYVSDEYFGGGAAGYDDYHAQERSLRAGFRALLAKLQALGVTGGRLLEIGSGYGYFLDEARPYFAERVGVELSPRAAESATVLAEASVFGSIEQLPTDAPFDCVFASHVIEHIYDPVSFTRQLLAHLRPDGYIVYSTPDMNSYWRKLMGKHWPSFKIPEHVAFFDGKTLPGLLTTAGAVEPKRINVTDRFSPSQILQKLHLPAPQILERASIPLPGVSVCCMARKPGQSSE
jgi:SAM-dependent methyltransferase